MVVNFVMKENQSDLRYIPQSWNSSGVILLFTLSVKTPVLEEFFFPTFHSLRRSSICTNLGKSFYIFSKFFSLFTGHRSISSPLIDYEKKAVGL